jgi:hypothetical protein
MDCQKIKITQIKAKLTSEIRCCYLGLIVNNKHIEISVYRSFNNYINCYSNDGWKLLNRNVDLTAKEMKAIDDYIVISDLSRIR